jgi:hypothetical protein
MPKGTIVMVGLGKPPARKGMMPPKFGGDRPLPEKKPAMSPPMVSEEPQEKEGDPAVIETLAALADQLKLPHVADAIRQCGEESQESPEEENTEHASGEEPMDE